MSRVPVSSSYSRPRSGLADAAVDNVRPESLASLGSLAPSLSQYALGNGAGTVGAVAGGESSMARGAVDGFTATPVGQLGVTAFTEGIYTEGGHINPAFSEAMTNSAGQMMTELVGEETMDKMERMEQKMARAVDKITDVEVSAGELAMVAGVMDYLPEGEEEPAVPEDVPDAGETPDLFTTPLEEPVEADVTVPDMQELNVGELERMGGPTDEYIPQMEVSRPCGRGGLTRREALSGHTDRVRSCEKRNSKQEKDWEANVSGECLGAPSRLRGPTRPLSLRTA